MAYVGELGLLAFALSVELGLWIGGGGMGFVAALLVVEVALAPGGQLKVRHGKGGARHTGAQMTAREYAGFGVCSANGSFGRVDGLRKMGTVTASVDSEPPSHASRTFARPPIAACAGAWRGLLKNDGTFFVPAG